MSTLNVHTPHTYCPGLHCYYRSKSFTSGKTLAGALNDKDDSKKKKKMFSVIFFFQGSKAKHKESLFHLQFQDSSIVVFEAAFADYQGFAGG